MLLFSELPGILSIRPLVNTANENRSSIKDRSQFFTLFVVNSTQPIKTYIWKFIYRKPVLVTLKTGNTIFKL